MFFKLAALKTMIILILTVTTTFTTSIYAKLQCKCIKIWQLIINFLAGVSIAFDFPLPQFKRYHISSKLEHFGDDSVTVKVTVKINVCKTRKKVLALFFTADNLLPNLQVISQLIKTWVFKWNFDLICHTIHPAFTCSKLTIETLEQGVKYIQS